MTAAEVEAILGREQKEKALSRLSNYEHATGVFVDFSYADGVIDYIWFLGSKFPRETAVCGVCIGMSVDAMKMALPGVNLADGETGEPDERGFVRYQAKSASENAAIQIAVKNGEVTSFTLRRLDLDEVQARRERQEVERRAERDRELERASRWKSIADPNEMLLRWAEHCSPWNDYTPDRFVTFARWLMATRDPDIWHIAATRWNWDYDHAVPLWVIRQTDCDIATALEVFFLASPSYYFRWGNDRSSVPDGWEREHYDFLAEIRERLAQGFYTRSQIAFDGEKQMSYIYPGLKTDEDKALAASFFPREAGMKIGGRDPEQSISEATGKCYAMLATVN
jgi:hypothetical protein